MIDFLSQLNDVILNFHLRDFFDIVIIAILIYAILKLFIKTRSIPILAGIIILVLLYGLAIFFNFPLTKIALRSFFGTFFIILAIIFQRELRRFFGFLGALGMRRETNLPHKNILKIVAETVFYFSKKRTGALIVFPGFESIDRYTEGGFLLNGRISEQIFESIFDKNSAGHDGAVVIENDRLKKFAVHLPLTDNPQVSKKYGTRHRAAIGITERSDALCIVVSEENGVVSVAKDGILKVVNNPSDIEVRLNNFFFERFPQKSKGGYKNFLKKNIIYILISVSFAIIFWIIFYF